MFDTAKYDETSSTRDNVLAWEKLACKAGLQDVNDRLLQKLIKQHPDPHICTKALEQNWDLERFIESAAAREIAKAASSSIRNNNSEEKKVFKVDLKSGPSKDFSKKQNIAKQECGRCGYKPCPSMEQKECPAKNAACRFCGGMGHFIAKCRKRQREMQSRGGKFNRPMNNSTALPQKQQWGQGPSARQNRSDAAPVMSNDQIQKLLHQKAKYKKLAKKGAKPSKSKRFVNEVKEGAITEDSDNEPDTSETSSDSD